MLENDYLPFLRAQALESLADPHLDVSLHGSLLRIDGLYRDAALTLLLHHLVDGVLLPAPAPAEVIQAQVFQDTVEPGKETFGRIESLYMPESVDKGVL